LFESLFLNSNIVKIGQDWASDMAHLKKDRTAAAGEALLSEGSSSSPYDLTRGLVELSAVFAQAVPFFGPMPSLKVILLLSNYIVTPSQTRLLFIPLHSNCIATLF